MYIALEYIYNRFCCPLFWMALAPVWAVVRGACSRQFSMFSWEPYVYEDDSLDREILDFGDSCSLACATGR